MDKIKLAKLIGHIILGIFIFAGVFLAVLNGIYSGRARELLDEISGTISKVEIGLEQQRKTTLELAERIQSTLDGLQVVRNELATVGNNFSEFRKSFTRIDGSLKQMAFSIGALTAGVDQFDELNEDFRRFIEGNKAGE
jgi:septal ring factor EnvC (AmiA/AmiB activator)